MKVAILEGGVNISSPHTSTANLARHFSFLFFLLVLVFFHRKYLTEITSFTTLGRCLCPSQIGDNVEIQKLKMQCNISAASSV